MVRDKINLEVFDTPSGSSGCGSCGSAAGGARCGNGLEKIYPTTAVRYGYMRYIGEFSHAPEMKFTCGAKVVIATSRGIEVGEQVSLSCSGCDKSVKREQIKDWVSTNGHDSFIFEAGRILREATAGDLSEYAHIQEGLKEKRQFAQRVAERHGLPMKVVESEHLFGGERIIFYFTADERIDFRGLVKDLAREYRTRIEMRQIGARDEARLLADYETCGREVCCKTFLKTLKPISMRMAKLQKATLDPSQVSGRCGRLKCCLRYEHESYEELDKRLPGMGKRISTVHGVGVVVNRQILTQLIQIRKDDDTLITVVVEDLGEPAVEPAKRPAADAKTAGRERTEGDGTDAGRNRGRRRGRGRTAKTRGTRGGRGQQASDGTQSSEDAPREKGEQASGGESTRPRERGARRDRRRGGDSTKDSQVEGGASESQGPPDLTDRAGTGGQGGGEDQSNLPGMSGDASPPAPHKGEKPDGDGEDAGRKRARGGRRRRRRPRRRGGGPGDERGNGETDSGGGSNSDE